VSDVERIETGVRQGQCRRLGDATLRLNELRPSIQVLKDILGHFAEVPDDKRDDVLRQMNDATNLQKVSQSSLYTFSVSAAKFIV
jgi:hypothetical protein